MGFKGEKGLNAAQKMFDELTDRKGGKGITLKGYKGTMLEFPNGDRVGIRPVSRHGEPAIDVYTHSTGITLKFKFPETSTKK